MTRSSQDDDDWEDDLVKLAEKSLDRSSLTTRDDRPSSPTYNRQRLPESSSSSSKPRLSSVVTRHAVFEIPLRVSDENGFEISQQHSADLSIATSMPLRRHVKASLQASSHRRNRLGQSNLQGTVTYRAREFLDMTGGLKLVEQPWILIGTTIHDINNVDKVRRLDTQLQVRTDRRAWEATMTASTLVQSRFTVRTFGRLYSALPPAMGIRVQSTQTLHPWGVGLCFWNWDKKWPRLQFSLTPKLSNKHQLHVTGSYQYDTWSLSIASRTQTTTTTITNNGHGTSFQVGFSRHGQGWTWLFQLSHPQGWTLRIPITISTLLSSTWYPLQLVYLAFVSHVVQQAVQQVVAVHCPADHLPVLRAHHHSKSRYEALEQQRLMEKQAKQRKADQESNQGLIIDQAMYAFQETVLDVTIPLQFWVTSQSILQLPASSKRHLLGFCDVRDDAAATVTSHTDDAVVPRDWSTWWRGFWTVSTTPPSSHALQKVPTLTIHYTYRGVAYERVVADGDAVRLPN